MWLVVPSERRQRRATTASAHGPACCCPTGAQLSTDGLSSSQVLQMQGVHVLRGLRGTAIAESEGQPLTAASTVAEEGEEGEA